MKSTHFLIVALFSLSTFACAEAEDSNVELRAGVAAQAEKITCEEEYYFVVEGDTEKAAVTACDEVCEGVICKDGEDAIASVPGNAGDKDSWLCDCKCGCPDEIDALPAAF